mgnify:CR=1 FL=1
MTKRSLASFRADSWLWALLLAGSALAGASCAPVCRWAEGACIDLRVEGRPLSQVRRAAMALKAGGVGYYPRSGFVHVDTGDIRYW